jgi:hypothetical protein
VNTIKNETIRIGDAGSASNLICPRCGSGDICHSGAVFYQRGEDAPSLVRIAVEGSNVGTSVIPSEKSGNPSSRRHGMTIQFDCEQCSSEGDVLELNIAQHKGVTLLSWSYSPRLGETSA